MIGQSFFHSSIIVAFWICAVLAAPAEEDDTAMEKNMSSSCFKDTLPEKLQLHYDMCMGNNLSEDNSSMKENEILSCILKTEGVITDEAMDISKLKAPVPEEEATDMKMIEETNPFLMSVTKCETNEEGKEAEDFVQCLYEALTMNCTNSMASDAEEPAAAEAPEER